MSRSLHRQSVYLQQNSSNPVLEKIHEPKYYLLLLLLHEMDFRHYSDDQIQIYKEIKIEFNEVHRLIFCQILVGGGREKI